MNHWKISCILLEYNDCLDLLSFFLNRDNHENCNNIIRYLRILGNDLDNLINESHLSRGEGKSHPNLAETKSDPFGEGHGFCDGELAIDRCKSEFGVGDKVIIKFLSEEAKEG